MLNSALLPVSTGLKALHENQTGLPLSPRDADYAVVRCMIDSSGDGSRGDILRGLA